MIVVVGLGRETRQLLSVLDRDRPGTEVLVLDERRTTTSDLPELATLRVRVTDQVDLDDPDVVPSETTQIYRSPGVSPYRPGIDAAVRRGVSVTTPTGWWAANRDGHDVIAITGTKGKSTTSALTAHLLRAAGREVALVGNIGRSALDAQAPLRAADDIVLELSSYQLADLDARFGLAGITTLLQDHVPWHGSLERYHSDKLRLLALAERTIVTQQVADAIDPTGAVGAVTGDVWRPEIREALADAGLVGEHLVHDAQLALSLADARLGRGAGVVDLIAALADFQPLPHRLTPVRDHAGVVWVDDSISTVPESAVAAVDAYRQRGPVTVLLGGDDRGQDLAPLAELLADAGVYAILLPPLGERLEATLRPVADGRVESAIDLPAAVRRAAEVTPPGGAVVLSPAAPSFSAYQDFVARGEHFVSLVTELP